MQLAVHHIQQCFDPERHWTHQPAKQNHSAPCDTLWTKGMNKWIWLKLNASMKSLGKISTFWWLKCPLVYLKILHVHGCAWLFFWGGFFGATTLTISRVLSRASSWIEACCTAGHRILLSRRHIWGPVLQIQNKESDKTTTDERIELWEPQVNLCSLHSNVHYWPE